MLAGFIPTAHAQGPSVVSPQAVDRIAVARATGFWVIREGDHLYRISRHFAPEGAEVSRLAKELQEINGHAMMFGDPSRLVVGARLRLPERLVTGRTVASPPATAPPSIAGGAREPKQALPPTSSIDRKPPGPDAAPTALPASLQADSKPAPAYVDQLIDGALVETEDRRSEERARDTSPGLRSWAFEYRLDGRDTNTLGSSVSQGTRLQHRRETERYGDFAIDAEFGRESTDSGQGGPGTSSSKVTVYHENFALSGNAVANSTLGVTRLALSPFLASSYRVSLPSSTIAGATTSVAMPDGEWRAGVGRLGRISGSSVQDFEFTRGRIASLEYARRLADQWIAGAGIVSVHGSDVVRDNTTLTLGTEFALPELASRFKVQGIVDDRAAKGFWVDAQRRDGRLAQRFGGYQLDPDLIFSDATPLRDTRGLYWRGDYRSGADFTSIGVEAAQTNLDRDPGRGGATSVGATVNTTLRIDRTFTAGAGLSIRDERPRTPLGEGREVGLASAFVSRSNPWGQSRLDASLNLTRPEVSRTERIRTFSWSQDWPRAAAIETNSLVMLSDEFLADRQVRRLSASLGLRGPLYGSLRWDASVTGVDIQDGPDSERNYNSNLSLDWNPAASWLVRLQWQRNRIQPSPDNPQSRFLRENVVQLTARYELSQGTPYPSVGAATGRSGTGRIAGVVFFDENGDGAKQATERVAAGIIVVLDGRRFETTDAEGRFTFALVPSGDHRVAIVVERVPLPWGLEDESPRVVKVEVREDIRLDIGLKRISP